MTTERLLATEQELTTETLLWRGVIARTIQDWLSKPLRSKREAERYLFENSPDLSSVCASAGIDIVRLRTRLTMVRGRTLRELLPVAEEPWAKKKNQTGPCPPDWSMNWRTPVTKTVRARQTKHFGKRHHQT